MINRSVRRARLFDAPEDYRALVRTFVEAQQRVPIRVLAYCVMPNHFHFVLWPREDGHLSRFMHWFTLTHCKRWHVHRGSTGTGSVYQGRFRAIPVQTDNHFLTVCRYVERNPLRASLVTRAEDWPWSSLHQRCKNCNGPDLERWPILQPEQWLALVNASAEDQGIAALRRCVKRQEPFGDDGWVRSQTTPGVV